MKKLFLTSITRTDKLIRMVAKKPNDIRVAFIPTAGDPYEDKWFVDNDRKSFIDLGCKLIDVDLKNKDLETLNELLADCDIIYVCGGNVFYLLEKMKTSGFDKIILPLLEEGVIYAGASAGAVVAGPSVEPLKLLDNPGEAPTLISYGGLNLVDFLILPHYGKEKYAEGHRVAKEQCQKMGIEALPLRDGQSVVVENKKYEIV
ncbi:MAG: Type 1 glutamine amidotransferase-like domain-containing protein [Patescibacteria group bacterium]